MTSSVRFAIMNAIGLPHMSYPNTSPTSCHLFRIINTVKNNASFVERIRTFFMDSDEILVSFDVESLFTCVPTQPSHRSSSVKERLDSDQLLPERTDVLSIQNIMTLLQFVLDNNSSFPRHPFPTNFRLSDGIPSRLHLSQSLHRTCQGEKTLTPNPFKWWFRYADNSYVCVKREHVNEFRSHINSINPQIYNRDRLRRLHCLS